MSENEEIVKQNDSTIVVETLKIYGSFYIVSFVLFCCLRQCYPRLFNIRSWAPKLKCSLAQENYGFLSWCWKIFEVQDEDIFRQCGMDALCFIRAMRFGRNLGIVGSLNAVWLIPLYATAKDSSETDYLEDGLVVITISNLPNQSSRYVGTLIATYITFLAAMYFILQEMEWYTVWRHRFLAKREPRNFAVYVAGIPREWRTAKDLAKYFVNCTSADAVLEAHIALDVPKLEYHQAQRDEIVRKLEHTVAKNRLTGSTSTHHRISLQDGIDKVDTEAHLKTELDELNRSIPADIQKIMLENERDISQPRRIGGTRDLMAQGDHGVDDIAPFDPESSHLPSRTLEDENYCPRKRVLTLVDEDPSLSEAEVKVVGSEQDAESLVDGKENNSVSESISTNRGREIEKSTATNVDSTSGSSHSRRSRSSSAGPRKRLYAGVDLISSSVTTTISSGSAVARSTLKKSSQVATGAIKMMKDVQVDKVIKSAAETGAGGVSRVGNQLASSASAVVPILRVKDEGSPRDAGFVVFRRLYNVQSVLQMIHDSRPYVMNCFEAPEPGDIFWRNVGLSAKARRIGTLLSVSATTVTCIFWSVPMSLISSLTEVNSLKETLPKLGRFIDENPQFEPLLVQVAPLILLIINEVFLPMILKHFAKWEGGVSAAMLEASLFLKLGVFMILQTFFVSAISGGISAELTNMISNPERIVDLLANSLPAQSTYFVQIILTATFIIQSIELLRLYPLMLSFLRRFFGPRLTAKERSQSWMWLSSLEDPPDFWHAETFAQVILYFMVFFVYTVIAPFTSFVVLICFLLLEAGYRYQFIYNYPRAFDTGGKLWFYFLQFILVCMIVAQVTLIGLMALKQSKYASPVLIPLLVITCLFAVHINSQHAAITRHLPTRQCIEEDERFLLADEEEVGDAHDFDFVKNAYQQPPLKRRIMKPEYEES